MPGKCKCIDCQFKPQLIAEDTVHQTTRIYSYKGPILTPVIHTTLDSPGSQVVPSSCHVSLDLGGHSISLVSPKTPSFGISNLKALGLISCGRDNWHLVAQLQMAQMACPVHGMDVTWLDQLTVSPCLSYSLCPWEVGHQSRGGGFTVIF